MRCVYKLYVCDYVKNMLRSVVIAVLIACVIAAPVPMVTTTAPATIVATTPPETSTYVNESLLSINDAEWLDALFNISEVELLGKDNNTLHWFYMNMQESIKKDIKRFRDGIKAANVEIGEVIIKDIELNITVQDAQDIIDEAKKPLLHTGPKKHHRRHGRRDLHEYEVNSAPSGCTSHLCTSIEEFISYVAKLNKVLSG